MLNLTTAIISTIHLGIDSFHIARSDERITKSLLESYNKGDVPSTIALLAPIIFSAFVVRKAFTALVDFSFRIVGISDTNLVKIIKAFADNLLISSVAKYFIPRCNQLYHFIHDTTGLLPQKPMSDLPPPFSWVVKP